MNGLEISDLLGLSQPLTKLIEVVSNGIGLLYEPIHIERMAKAKAKEIELISSAIRDNADLFQNYQFGNVSVANESGNGIIDRAQHRMAFQEVIYQNNTEAVIANAYNELKEESSVAEDSVDMDWVTRFFSIVKEISSEEMQFIWGKILAGEIKQPGSFSLRTLETIRNMSQVEAQAFQRLLSYIVNVADDIVIIKSGNKINEKYELQFNDILLLDECGLIISSQELSLNKKFEDGEDGIVMFCTDNLALYVTSDNTKKTLHIPARKFSTAGKELFNILYHTPQDEYFFDIVSEIAKENSDFIFQIHRVNEIHEDHISCDDEVIKIYNKQKDEVEIPSFMDYLSW